MKQYILILCTTILFSCGTTKESTTATRTSEQELIEQLSDSLAVYREETRQLKAELFLLQQYGIVFDNPEPKIIQIPGACNWDSVQKEVGKLRQHYANKIEILEDGSLRAEGSIKSAMATKSRWETLAATWKSKYDSLKNSSVNRETKTEIKEVYKDRIVKRSFIPWWVWVALAILGILFLDSKFGIINKLKRF